MLVGRCQNSDLIAVLQLLPDGYILIANSSADTVRTDFAVYRIRKIQYRSTFRQTTQIACRREDKHIAGTLHNRAFDSFIRPVCSHALFGHFVHSFRTDLHFHPAFVGTQNGSVQGLVPVLFGHRKPIAQTLGVRREDIRDERIDLPAVRLLFLQRRVQDDADGKQIVDSVHITMLRLHLMVNRMNGLRASLDSKSESRVLQFGLKRCDEPRYVVLAFRFLRA